MLKMRTRAKGGRFEMVRAAAPKAVGERTSQGMGKITTLARSGAAATERGV
jgi:hypothetical protein